jgi:uncharacterized protein YciW
MDERQEFERALDDLELAFGMKHDATIDDARAAVLALYDRAALAAPPALAALRELVACHDAILDGWYERRLVAAWAEARKVVAQADCKTPAEYREKMLAEHPERAEGIERARERLHALASAPDEGRVK